MQFESVHDDEISDYIVWSSTQNTLQTGLLPILIKLVLVSLLFNKLNYPSCFIIFKMDSHTN